VGGQSGEAGSDQMGGRFGEGGAGGDDEQPACGNGRVESGEACDDGGATDGDGCSEGCAVEDGFTCSAATCDARDGRCQRRLPITFRDFNGFTQAGGHRDFGPTMEGPGAVMGLVHSELDEDGKPVLVAAHAPSFLHTGEEFAQWYRDTPEVNASVVKELVLWNDGDGKYTNRWGANGERWRGEAGEPPLEFDGAPLFFPVDGAPSVLLETKFEGRVAAQYGWTTWQAEVDVAMEMGISASFETAWSPFPSKLHNFNFTSELEFALVHDAAVTTTIDVQGDDDIWVFVNGSLAVDLGSFHVPMAGSITIAGNSVITSSQTGITTAPTVVTEERTAAEFGLVEGEPYEVAIFHAERQRHGATFRLSVSGVDWARSVCVPLP
jgi:fibro-slime domain-containing protein